MGLKPRKVSFVSHTKTGKEGKTKEERKPDNLVPQHVLVADLEALVADLEARDCSFDQ
jgi:hypothetical protein